MRKMLKALDLLLLTHFLLLEEALGNKIKTTNKQSHTQSYHLSHCLAGEFRHNSLLEIIPVFWPPVLLEPN